MLLALSDVERGIYDNCISDLEKRQLCCHLQVVSRLQAVVGPQLMTLDEVKVVMISHTKNVGCAFDEMFKCVTSGIYLILIFVTLVTVNQISKRFEQLNTASSEVVSSLELLLILISIMLIVAEEMTFARPVV